MVDTTALVNAEKKSNQEKPASADIAHNRKDNSRDNHKVNFSIWNNFVI